MKTSGNIPGALYADAIPDALNALNERVKLESNEDDEQSSDDESHVGIKTKALPLMELMQKAIEQNEKLLWEQG